VRSRENHKKGLKDNYGRLAKFLSQNFKTFLIQLAWFSWPFLHH